ncbi:Tol-Pal system beta propeller repeat protein TolB [Entomobacter blattae]|uniref:Tol-Pal system protein TolB n=1 Tax=Entomobacter blattae TaxID=2762277 RepID=A0A7H1NTD7_9PROT|nr:Protein TolB [Entomobacter blattae]
MKPTITDHEAEVLSKLFLKRRTAIGAGLGVAGSIALSPLFSAHAQDDDSAPGASEITVDKARSEPIPIVVPSFGSGTGDQITKVITDDLNNTGLFRVIAGATPAGATPDFESYKNMGARALVTGSAAGGGSRVEFRLWDVLTGQQIQGTAFSTAQANWRRIAHMIGDIIYERMLGEKGYFDTRIAYIARSGPLKHQETRLAIMDQDGANNRVLTNGRWLTLTPRFSPHRDQLAFMSYANNMPRVYVYNLSTGRQRILGHFEGISFAPRFSPSGSSVVMSVTRGAGSDLYSVDLGSGRKHQLTSSGAIDTSPCYSPDGSQIVFNSDRGGKPQLYIMSASGGGARRISFGSGSYGSPVWSPRGDLIAFTRIAHGGFSVGVMAPDGSGERILTQGYTVESPTFCPNGRVLAFCRQGGGGSSGIGCIDISGMHERPIRTAGAASDPAWSPREE